MKEQGLEAQLLGIVVRKERPELEEQKDKLVVNIAQSKKKLVELEDEILRYRVGSLQHPFCPMLVAIASDRDPHVKRKIVYCTLKGPLSLPIPQACRHRE